MGETIGSRDCEQGRHMDCGGCKGCRCHPRSGRPAPVWDTNAPTQTAMRGSRTRPQEP